MVAGISNFAVLSKTLFADVFYSDDPVSDTDQPEYVDEQAMYEMVLEVFYRKAGKDHEK